MERGRSCREGLDASGERAKNGIEHVVPLSDAALSILEGLPRIGRRDGFVFTTTGETPMSGWSRAKAALDAASGVADLAPSTTFAARLQPVLPGSASPCPWSRRS